MSSEKKDWKCIHCKEMLTLNEAKIHAKLGGYHACYPISNENKQ